MKCLKCEGWTEFNICEDCGYDNVTDRYFPRIDGKSVTTVLRDRINELRDHVSELQDTIDHMEASAESHSDKRDEDQKAIKEMWDALLQLGARLPLMPPGC